MNIDIEDYQAWIQSQINVLRAKRFDELDVEHLIEEMEEMGGSDRRALTSHLIVLLAHLLKWRFQPEHRRSSWRGSIVEQRVQIEALTESAPSLARMVPELAVHAYPKALKIATKETGIGLDRLPSIPPFSVEQLLDEDYFPEN